MIGAIFHLSFHFFFFHCAIPNSSFSILRFWAESEGSRRDRDTKTSFGFRVTQTRACSHSLRDTFLDPLLSDGRVTHRAFSINTRSKRETLIQFSSPLLHRRHEANFAKADHENISTHAVDSESKLFWSRLERFCNKDMSQGQDHFEMKWSKCVRFFWRCFTAEHLKSFIPKTLFLVIFLIKFNI